MNKMKLSLEMVNDLLKNGCTLCDALKQASVEYGIGVLSLRNAYYKGGRTTGNVVQMPKNSELSQGDIKLLFGGIINILKKKIYDETKIVYEKKLEDLQKKQYTLEKQIAKLKNANMKLIEKINNEEKVKNVKNF